MLASWPKNTKYSMSRSARSLRTSSDRRATHIRAEISSRDWSLQIYVSTIQFDCIVPDELIIDLVKTRLSKPDCKLNGWILDGCPTTPEQIAKLTQLGITPSLVVALDQSDSMVYEKLEQRRFDPIEGKFYNLLKDTIPREVQSRLTQEPSHTHPIVKRKLQDYRNFLATVESDYRKQLVRINAEEDGSEATGVSRVFINLCDAIENTV